MALAKRSLLAPLALLALAVVALPAPASAHWGANGSGSGAGTAATMPTAGQPAGAASGQSVTVSWAQNTFAGSLLGSYALGGYTVTRYTAGTGVATKPSAGCDTAIRGTTATLQCVESGVPYGLWQYAITPVLGSSFTGSQGAKSATVAVVPPAPTPVTATAQNPAAGQSAGAIAIQWSAVAGATGYNLYRRVASGSYDFASPINGSTPFTATTYTDPGAGLTGGTSYHYVVRAVAGLPGVESPSSTDVNATAIARPSAPATVTAVAGPGGRIDVSFTGVAGVAGYNVYRRTATGSYDFNAPLNGANPYSGTTLGDTTAVNATTYRYTVRAVSSGAGGTQIESANSAETAPATSDSVAPPAPSAVAVGSGGNVLAGAICGVASGTRYINAAGQAAVSVTATIPAPEAGESLVFSATTSGPTPVTATVAATGTSVPTSLNLTTLPDGTVGLTARTRDAAGNLSAAISPANTIIKDIAVPALTASYSKVLARISGASECGATIGATETQGPRPGSVYTMQITTGTSYNLTTERPVTGTIKFNVTATDLAGNVSATVVVSG
jgi:hypothetical protein